MSDLVGPNGNPINTTAFTLARAQIGGVECEYQTDPRVGINKIVPEAFGLVGILIGSPPTPVYVLASPENLLGFMASQINMNSALTRELLTQREQINALTAALEDAMRAYREGLAEGAAAAERDLAEQAAPEG